MPKPIGRSKTGFGISSHTANQPRRLCAPGQGLDEKIPKIELVFVYFKKVLDDSLGNGRYRRY